MLTSRFRRARRHALALPFVVAAAVAASCGEPLSQIAVVIDTALCEPGDGAAPDFDRVRVTVEGVVEPFCAVFTDPGASECVQISTGDFPLVLPIVSESGTGAPRVQVELFEGTEVVGCATGTASFEQGETRVVRIDVERACGAVACVDGLTVLEPDTDPLAIAARACEPPAEDPEGEIVRIAAGAQHACLVDSNGHVFCWGSNDHGQLGLAASAVPVRARPTRVAPITNFVLDVDGGQSHTCAIVSTGTGDGRVFCWGRGSDGQLGNNQNVSTATPVLVGTGLNDAVRVALGPFHSCAVFGAEGAVQCWGANLLGELNGAPGDPERSPILVGVPDGPEGFPDALELAAGGNPFTEIADGASRHTCARTSHGVYCWGADDAGQLGRASDGPEVAALEGLTDAVQITAASRATCAADGAGQIWCWGRNEVPGTLGFATTAQATVAVPTPIEAATDVAPPVAVPSGGPPLSTLDSGDNFRCFIDSAGAVWCFGSNFEQRLGFPGADGTPTPRQVELPEGTRFKQVVTGTAFACALPEDGSLPWCWGNDSAGQLGRGGTGSSPEPMQIPDCR